MQGGLPGVGAVLFFAAAGQAGPARDDLVRGLGGQVPDDLQHHDVRVARAGHYPDVAGPACGAQDIPGRCQVARGGPGPAP